jgi:hypothetical protein
MVKQPQKMTPVSKARIMKPASPKKVKYAPSMKDNLIKKKQKPILMISVLGFQDPLYIEVYKYTLTENKAGFINNFRKWSRGKLICNSLTEANFIGMKLQHDFNNNGNQHLLYDNDSARFWMIRYPPQNVSTAVTRKEGLHVLKTFLMSTQATNYPPGSINVDITKETPAVMEKIFLDEDIEEIVKALLHIDKLNNRFYCKYTELAQTI